MKLFYSPTSPFVRKVMVVALELGLADRLEKVTVKADPVDRNRTIAAENPLAQVPTLVTDDGAALYDSRVICEYLDAEAGGRLFGSGKQRFQNLTNGALSDGLMSAAVLGRYEVVLRPKERQWDGWVEGQRGKVTDALDQIERLAPSLGNRIDIGTIGFGCALGYLDFRYSDLAWRDGRPAAASWFATLSERPSFKSTAPA